MSNDPFPTPEQLRLQVSADRLLDRQAASEEAFRKLIARFEADFARLDFPLGAPTLDLEFDLLGANDLETAAFDAARQELMP